MTYFYSDLHIHTSEDANSINKAYDVAKLKTKVELMAKNHEYLISLTDHNTINEEAYINMLKLNINFIVGVELHIKNYDGAPAYHCHFYFDLKYKDDISLRSEITKLNEILDRLYPDKLPVLTLSTIPTIETLIKAFDKYEFLVLPHGGQSHCTFDTSIPSGTVFDTVLEKSLYYNFFDGFTSRTTEKVEETNKYFKRLGINSFVNLLTCSDNYNVDKYPLGKDGIDNFIPTWIFSSPNYNGLKIALTESSRLYYTKEPKVTEQDLIKSAKISNDKIKIDVTFEPGLNVIIGNSSSGKTLLVDTLDRKLNGKNIFDGNYAKFGVENIEIVNPTGISPHYFEQNYILSIVGPSDNKDNSLDTNPFLRKVFPLDKEFGERISLTTQKASSYVSDLVESVKTISSSKDAISKLPLFSMMVYKGETLVNPLKCLLVSTNEKEKLYITDIGKKQIEDSLQILISEQKRLAFVEDINNEIESIRNKFNKAYAEITFANLANDIINAESGKIDEDLKEINGNKTKAEKEKESLLKETSILFGAYDKFFSSLGKLISIKEKIETKEIESAGHKLYIENSFEINKDVIGEIFGKYLLSFNSANIKPEDFFESNIRKRSPKVNDIDDFKNRVINDITQKNKTTYKIKYKGKRDFDELSPGLKASTILDIILGYSKDNAPLIIDQPEDNLAMSYINRDLILAIKKAKIQRQIIIVSHNATIPMLGDAQNVIVCENNNGKIEISSHHLEDNNGEKTITDVIANLTDGGKASIKKRFKKYNMKSFIEDEKYED